MEREIGWDRGVGGGARFRDGEAVNFLSINFEREDVGERSGFVGDDGNDADEGAEVGLREDDGVFGVVGTLDGVVGASVGDGVEFDIAVFCDIF